MNRTSMFTTTDEAGDRLTLMAFGGGWVFLTRPKGGPAASVYLNEDQLLEMHASIGQALHPAGRRVGAPPEDTQRVRLPLSGHSVSPPRWVSQILRHFGG